MSMEVSPDGKPQCVYTYTSVHIAWQSRAQVLVLMFMPLTHSPIMIPNNIVVPV